MPLGRVSENNHLVSYDIRMQQGPFLLKTQLAERERNEAEELIPSFAFASASQHSLKARNGKTSVKECFRFAAHARCFRLVSPAQIARPFCSNILHGGSLSEYGLCTFIAYNKGIHSC